MMVLLEMLSRAYGKERETETFEALMPVDQAAVAELAADAFDRERGESRPARYTEMTIARAGDIPDGERKIVQVDGLSIGVFHHNGNWFALRNSCLHRGGPVATGPLNGDTLVCPWHGFQYNITTGQFLNDPNARLDMYPVGVRDGEVRLQIPDARPSSAASALKENEFRAGEIAPGQAKRVALDGEDVAVYNVDGTFYATQDACTHAGGPLSEGSLEGDVITCPWHGSCFNVISGQVVCGPAREPVKTYRVAVEGQIGRVESKP
jgi:nitrite reductase/ring-hydroxylating ferredoxin subunit